MGQNSVLLSTYDSRAYGPLLPQSQGLQTLCKTGFGRGTYQQPASSLEATWQHAQLKACPTAQGLPVQQLKSRFNSSRPAQRLPAQQLKGCLLNNLRPAHLTAPASGARKRAAQTAPEGGVALSNGSRAPRASSKCPRSNSRAFCKHFRAPEIAGPTASSPQN